MKIPHAELRDDGTLDTVIQVGNKTYRYSFDGGDGSQTYDDFIEWALVDAEEQYSIEAGEAE